MPASTQKTINNEDENFEKIITFEGNEIAIVDAAVVKSLKHTPLAKGAVYIPLKTSLENPSFKLLVKYDDATLRKLVMIPAASDEAEPDPSVPENDISEDAVEQLRGNGGDKLARKVAKFGNLKGKGHGNRLASRNNRPPVDPSKKMQSKLGQMGAKTGDPDPGVGPEPERRKVKQAESRRRSPAESKSNPWIESVCQFLVKVKNGEMTPEGTRDMPHKNSVLLTLKEMEARCFGGWKMGGERLVKLTGNGSKYFADPKSWDLHEGFLSHKGGKHYDFDLIYEAIECLRDKTKHVEPDIINSDVNKLFEELILRRLNLE